MTTHYDLDRDLREAEAMARSLVPYVHQEPLYGSVGGFGFFAAGNMPSLTLGALLLRTRRLDALDRDKQLARPQSQRLNKVLHRMEEVYQEFRRPYEAKLLREAASRLKAMQTFFEECFNDPRTCARNYLPEAMRRTIVQELLIALAALSIQPDEALQALLSSMDAKLRRYANEKHGFLLDERLIEIYPEGTFWWLYQEPHNPEK